MPPYLLLLLPLLSAARTSTYNRHLLPPPEPPTSPPQNTTSDCTSPTGGGCPLSSLNMREISINLIRSDILRKLHMDENNLPNVTTRDFPIPPAYLNEFINIQNDTPLDYDEDGASTEKIIAFSRIQQVKLSGRDPHTHAHYFTFSHKLQQMKVDSAILHLNIRHTPRGGGPTNTTRKWPDFRLKIYEVIFYADNGDSIITISHGPFKPYNVQAQQMELRHTSRSKWIQIHITNVLTKWIEKMTLHSDKKIGFVIEVTDLAGNGIQDVVVASTSEADVNINNPFIEIKVSDSPRPRHPRNIGMDCNENSPETRCCRFPLIIDFEEFGWDWIIAPKKYDANYCSGECPFAFLQKYPHNHIIQQAIPTGIGGPCCTARKMSPITMLYFDRESNIVFSILNGMVVDKCGCS